MIFLYKQNLSAKLGVKLLLGGANIILKRENLSARIGVKPKVWHPKNS